MTLSGHRVARIALTVSILLFAASAPAAVILPVNGAGSGVFTFDQPSVVLSWPAVHTAFIGDATGSGAFKVYYAAVNAGANLESTSTTQDAMLLTPAVVIDNGAPYQDARHPQIAVRTPGRLVVLFQAVPAGSTTGEYKLFRALIDISGNAVTRQVVNEIVGPGSVPLTGDLVDPSFKIAADDNALRIAYSDASTGQSNVYFAQAGIDNATLVAAPILLSSPVGSRGIKPLPRLQLDANGYSHVAWAANDNTGNPSGVYYSLVRKNGSGVPDNLAIGATQVVPGNYPWGFPNVIVETTSSVYVFAVDQTNDNSNRAGALAVTRLNPSVVTHDGNPVTNANVPALFHFFLSEPGGTRLAGEYETYRPDLSLDVRGYFHVAGYGYFSGTTLHGAPGTYYGFSSASLNDDDILPDLVFNPVSVGIGESSFGMQIAGDYTRAAFVHFNGGAFHFWSGPDSATAGAANLYVTSTPDTLDDSGSSSGCSIAGGSRGGGRFPGGLILLLPAILLLLRKAARKALART